MKHSAVKALPKSHNHSLSHFISQSKPTDHTGVWGQEVQFVRVLRITRPIWGQYCDSLTNLVIKGRSKKAGVLTAGATDA